MAPLEDRSAGGSLTVGALEQLDNGGLIAFGLGGEFIRRRLI
ncbi:MAG: hypothetical protein JWL77_5212 [Chthonomonadaceae bacterium]|nr:hypothetical protein [Chthonomonadaceae bacterium]